MATLLARQLYCVERQTKQPLKVGHFPILIVDTAPLCEEPSWFGKYIKRYAVPISGPIISEPAVRAAT
jgi:hypothetical protein